MPTKDDDGRHRLRPLEPDEIEVIRKIIEEWNRSNWSSMAEEWNRYKWAWGLVGRISAYTAGAIGVIWAGRDVISKIFKALLS